MVETTTLSEIIRRNTNITHVARHVFYSTQHCEDVENERCVPYLFNSSSPESDCDDELSTDEFQNLTNTVQLLRNKTYTLENKLTLNENEKQNLETQLTFWQRKYCDGCNSSLESNITALKQENEILRNSVSALKNAQAENSTQNDEAMLVFLIVLVCVLLISTLTVCVLYLKAKKEYKTLLYSKFDALDKIPTDTSGV